MTQTQISRGGGGDDEAIVKQQILGGIFPLPLLVNCNSSGRGFRTRALLGTSGEYFLTNLFIFHFDSESEEEVGWSRRKKRGRETI